MKPAIPKKSQNKIELAGSGIEAIYSALEEEMDGSVIPDYLGGSNILK